MVFFKRIRSCSKLLLKFAIIDHAYACVKYHSNNIVFTDTRIDYVTP